jgi:hypothetical protein
MFSEGTGGVSGNIHAFWLIFVHSGWLYVKNVTMMGESFGIIGPKRN